VRVRVLQRVPVLAARAAAGATADQMDEVDDADDSKAAAIALMLSLRRSLELAKVSALKKQLRGHGATGWCCSWRRRRLRYLQRR
jgi:hypothetical protein